MEDYFVEMRLSRAFACEFDKFISQQVNAHVDFPKELLEAYMKLKQHYDVEMNKNLS